MRLIDKRHFNLFQALLHQVASGLVSKSAVASSTPATSAPSFPPPTVAPFLAGQDRPCWQQMPNGFAMNHLRSIR